jgi:CO dehydrogenase/acetyl-CoA synthase gamma subunit (corrinoid Fe-S protein)
MDLEKYCRGETCELCKADSFDEFVARVKNGGIKSGACPHWPPGRLEGFRLAIEAGYTLPAVPMLDTPRPAAAGVMELIETDASSPVLVTGNSEFTQNLMLALIAMTSTPVKLVSVDCLGHTVDMAMVFKALTADKIAGALKDANISGGTARIVLPGLAQSLAAPLETMIGRAVEAGPICAAELPLYMGDDWHPLKKRN